MEQGLGGVWREWPLFQGGGHSPGDRIEGQEQVLLQANWEEKGKKAKRNWT